MTETKINKVAVLGLGLEGKDVLKYLLKNGYKDVTVLDKKEKRFLDLDGIDSSKLKFRTGKKYLEKGLNEFDIIYRSPGVYRYLPELKDAEKSGSVISSSTKLFFEKFYGRTVGVTGTKGKGTTSTLIYEILKNCGKKVFLAGNIGSPPLSILNNTDSNSIAVLEMSSFQLIDMEESPNIAVVLNITSDHMDWHKDRREYINAKKNIVKFQKAGDCKVINFDYRTPLSFSGLSRSENDFFSKEKKVKGVFVKNGVIIADIMGKVNIIGDTDKLLLRGRHNWENVCAAVCASIVAGADIDTVRKTVFSFKGLEHRLELVGEVAGISFYNDSFSTNPQTTIAAVDSFTEPITLILGGYDKGLDFDAMVKHLCITDNLEKVILMGNIEEKLFLLLKKFGFKKEIIKMGKSKMTDIVKKSIKLTRSGGIVLLSPAAASFDMFKDYKDRGNQFKNEVLKLTGKNTG